MDTSSRNRIYSSKTDHTMSALSHPVRSSLFNLIQQGVETIQEMADLLNENRINLYHHLSHLERAGLVTSNFNKNRLKIYQIIQPKKRIVSEESNLDPINDKVVTKTIVAFPKSGRQKEFQKKVQDLLKESLLTEEVGKNMNILHAQIVYQDKSIFEGKQQEVKKMKKLRK